MPRRSLTDPSVPLVAVLPASPVDGQQVDYLADAANGVIWRLRYRAASASTYKWEYVGGAPLFAFNDGSNTFSTINTWLVVSGVACNVTLPLTGDYDISLGARMTTQGASAGVQFGFGLGAVDPIDSDSVWGFNVNAGGARPIDSVSKHRRKSALVAGVVLTGKFKQTIAGTATVSDPWIEARPVRVG